MYEYEFFNSETNQFYFLIANSREDAIAEMKEKFPNSFNDWEYIKRNRVWGT